MFHQRRKLLLFSLFLKPCLLLAGQGFDCPHTHFVYIYIFFFLFHPNCFPSPSYCSSDTARNTASWIPTQRGEGRHSNSLPRHLICAWQPADRMEGWGRGWGGGGGKGYRKRWENTRKGLVGRRRDEEMLKCLTPKFCFGLLSSSFFIFSIWTCNISRNSKVLQLFWSLTPGSPTSVQKRRVPKKEKNRKTHVICIQQITWWD